MTKRDTSRSSSGEALPQRSVPADFDAFDRGYDRLDRSLKELRPPKLPGATNFLSAFSRSRRSEGLHSNLLSFFLRDEWHGAGSQFLRAFLELVWPKTEPLNWDKVSPEDTKVSREARMPGKGTIDLLISVGNLSVGVENKILAPEGKQQCERYARALKRAGGPWLLVFLTPKGSVPRLSAGVSARVIPLSYERLRDAFSRIKVEVPVANQILQDWMSAIENEVIVNNSGIDRNLYERCRLLYRENRAAMDVFLKFYPHPFWVELEDLIEKQDVWRISPPRPSHPGSRYLYLAGFAKKYGQAPSRYPDTPALFVECRLKPAKRIVTLAVRWKSEKGDEPSFLRKQLPERLKDAAPSISAKARRGKAALEIEYGDLSPSASVEAGLKVLRVMLEA